MLLGSLDPDATWQYAERYLGGGTRTYSPFAADLEISEQYHPQRGAPRFAVPTFWADAGGWLAGGLTSELPPLYRRGQRMLLPVHPEVLRSPGVHEQLAELPPGPALEVVPSANARTVFVARIGERAVPAHFAKLHYPKRLSRFTRRLRRPIIALQLWVAEELVAIGAPVLPEVAGGVIGSDPVQAWGFLLREAGVRGDKQLPYTVPLLALYGQDVRAPAGPTLLEQLVRASGEDAAGWLVRRVVTPMVTLWCEALWRTGCAIELHGQNTLLRFDPGTHATAIAYRDCAVYVDPLIREQRGLVRPLPPRNVIGHDITKPRGQVFSLVFDTFLGAHTLDYLARLAQQRLGVDPAALHEAARSALAQHPRVRELLPQTTYNYDRRLYDDGGWELVDSGAAPRWR